jgi:hypothetical protein
MLTVQLSNYSRLPELLASELQHAARAHAAYRFDRPDWVDAYLAIWPRSNFQKRPVHMC